MTETMTTSEALDRAADLIEERGWWRGRPETVAGICPMLAINEMAGDDHCLFHVASEVLEDYLGIYSIPRWNDAPERTSTEVIEVLRACALLEDARERSSLEVPA